LKGRSVEPRVESAAEISPFTGSKQEKRAMTVKTMNRSHRVIYLVVLLVFAVALTTALVLAGELRPEGSKSSTLQPNTVPNPSTVGVSGKSHA
jgi:hypothetical protein